MRPATLTDRVNQPVGEIFTSTQLLQYDGLEPLLLIKPRVLLNYWAGPPYADAVYELISLRLDDVTGCEDRPANRLDRLEKMEGDAPILRTMAALEERVSNHDRRLALVERRANELDVRVQAYISHLNVQLGSLVQLASTLLKRRSRASADEEQALAETGRRLAELRASRRGLRERGEMPMGEPGPVAGMRLARGSRPVLFVVFAGRSDPFGVLPNLTSLGFNVLYLIDDRDRWYLEGIPGARSVALMNAAIRTAVASFSVEKVIFFGQSMGGYGALLCASEIRPDLVAVFCPQTHHVGGPPPAGATRAVIPADAPDLRARTGASGVPTHIWTSLSERDNPPSDVFWDDRAQIEGLQGIPAVFLHDVASHQHAFSLELARAGRLDAALETIAGLATGQAGQLDPDALL